MGSFQSSCTECGGLIWGWWVLWEESFADSDPAREMSRTFIASSTATCYVDLTAYYCADSIIGNNYFVYLRNVTTGSNNNANKEEFWYNSLYENLGGAGGNQPGTFCSADIRKLDISDSFVVPEDRSFLITISQETSNGNGNAISFNNLQIYCDQIPTSSPTAVPSDYQLQILPDHQKVHQKNQQNPQRKNQHHHHRPVYQHKVQ